jgi:hypothetical protein
MKKYNIIIVNNLPQQYKNEQYVMYYVNGKPQNFLKPSHTQDVKNGNQQWNFPVLTENICYDVPKSCFIGKRYIV